VTLLGQGGGSPGRQPRQYPLANQNFGSTQSPNRSQCQPLVSGLSEVPFHDVLRVYSSSCRPILGFLYSHGNQ
jgi:hypothetical protein